MSLSGDNSLLNLEQPFGTSNEKNLSCFKEERIKTSACFTSGSTASRTAFENSESIIPQMPDLEWGLGFYTLLVNILVMLRRAWVFQEHL